jgi:hypothetical protein
VEMRDIWVDRDESFDEPWVVYESWMNETSGGTFYHSTWPTEKEAMQEQYRLLVTGEGQIDD